MKSIDDLLDFVERGRVADWLAVIEQAIGHFRLRVVLIKLLGWLKAQHRLQTKRPIDLNMAYTWCADLATVLAQNKHLVTMFAVSGNTVDFREDVCDDPKNEIRAKVDAGYRPRLMALK